MDLIDEDGNLLGYVNIVDFFVVLLTLSVVVAGIAFVAGESQDTSSNGSPRTVTPSTLIVEEAKTTVIFRVSDQPQYILDSIEEGPVPTEDIVAVEEIGYIRTGSNQFRVHMQITLNTTINRSSLLMFRGQRLFVGRQLTLDLETVRLQGVVSELLEGTTPSTPLSTPTQTPTATPTLTPSPTVSPTPTPTQRPTIETRTVVFRAQVPGYVADAIHTGSVPTPPVIAITDKSVLNASETAVLNASKTDNRLVRLEVELSVILTDEGLPVFQGKRLYVGRELQLDLGKTIVRGIVINFIDE